MANITEVLLTDIKHTRDFVRTSEGDLTLISGLDNLKEWVIRTIVTEPGTMVHRPSYGVGLQRFQNAPFTLAVQREIARRIDQVLRRDPRIAKINSVRFETNDTSPSDIVLRVNFDVTGYGETNVSFKPFGEDY